VKLEVDAYDREQKEKLAEGTLLSIDNQIDPNTGTVRLKAEFPNEDGALFPNQFVNARLLVDMQHDSTLVPMAAIQRSPDGTFTFVVKADGTVEMRPVKLGITEGDVASVASGLTPGESVVVEGADSLRDGSKVEPREHHKGSQKPDAS
jgi:multidrug efflux system membrane fusion protein